MESNEQQNTPVAERTVRFRWRFVLLPVIFLVLTLVLVSVFYGQLPAEAGYTFSGDGSVSRTTGRTSLVLWVGGIQLGLTLLSVVVARSITGVFNRYTEPDSTSVDPGSIITLMGNLVSLPQAIIFFALADIFSYNSYETHLLPLWLNALIFLLAGGIILSIFFLRALLKIRGSYKE